MSLLTLAQLKAEFDEFVERGAFTRTGLRAIEYLDHEDIYLPTEKPKMSPYYHRGVTAIRRLCAHDKKHLAEEILACVGASTLSDVSCSSLFGIVRALEEAALGVIRKPPTEKPKMTLEDAIIIARFGRYAHDNHARQRLIGEAKVLLRDRAEALMQAAEKKAEAERVLVDIQVYPDTFHNFENPRLWVKRVFSDGLTTKRKEPKEYAEQLKYTFEQGKAAAKLST